MAVLWAMKWGACVLPYSIRTTRKQCIADMLENFNEKPTWKTLQKWGYQAVKVRVNELGK